MANANTLTKSLHTVTAVQNVARLCVTLPGLQYRTPDGLAVAALRVLGYDAGKDFPKSDDTYQRCVAACAKLLQA